MNAGARVFEKVGIDYCCGGQRSLADACINAGVTIEEMLNSLELTKASHTQGEEPNLLTATLADLVDHIVAKHHAFTKTELQRLRALIETRLKLAGHRLGQSRTRCG